ncbi:MAG: hypothetical protein GY710_17145 [Desulfobacteraceae bacterium]|nr:hypothetical protein [Desulfobacteraceae bacterium]
MNPHLHFICTKCGSIIDFNCEILDTLNIQESIKIEGKLGVYKSIYRVNVLSVKLMTKSYQINKTKERKYARLEM